MIRDFEFINDEILRKEFQKYKEFVIVDKRKYDPNLCFTGGAYAFYEMI